VVLLAGFIVGSFWGPAGIAAAWLLLHPSLAGYSFTRVRRILDLKTSEYFQSLRLGLDGTAAMAIVLLAFQHFAAQAWAPGLRLTASILLGAATYALVTFAFHRARLLVIVDWLRRVRRGAAGPA
jgi:hypothetical protein